MIRNREFDSQHRDDKADRPATPPHAPIEPDLRSPEPEAPPDSESKPAARPDLDWAEHED